MRRCTRWDPPKGTPPYVLVRAYRQHLIGCNVRDELESRGMSMADLGRRLGVGGNYLDFRYPPSPLDLCLRQTLGRLPGMYVRSRHQTVLFPV